jgi:hypothetical protein
MSDTKSQIHQIASAICSKSQALNRSCNQPLMHVARRCIQRAPQKSVRRSAFAYGKSCVYVGLANVVYCILHQFLILLRGKVHFFQGQISSHTLSACAKYLVKRGRYDVLVAQ